jgi:UDP-glucose 4-epimerase
MNQMRAMPHVPLIFISSGGTVYGRPQQVPIPETHPTEPQCSYGIVKLAIEKYLALYHQKDGINYRVLRLGNPYGPGQEENQTQGVIGAFLSCIMSGQPIQVWGDGSVVRDYVYISDAVVALELAEQYQGQKRIFNIGSGNGHSVLEIISAIELVTGEKAKAYFTAKHPLNVPVSVLDNQRRVKEELGWHPQKNLPDDLRAMLAEMEGEGV